MTSTYTYSARNDERIKIRIPQKNSYNNKQRFKNTTFTNIWNQGTIQSVTTITENSGTILLSAARKLLLIA